MEKTVYIIGHRNPDTDSVVSAAAYAYLKQALGQKNHIAARAGTLAPQTEYIFNKFKVPVPAYIPDLLPKTGYYMKKGCDTVIENTSLWSAITKMEECNSKVLPVVDKDGKYISLLHYNAFAKNILKILNPEKEATISTNVKLLMETINAQPIVICNEEEMFKCSILVAAASFESFKKMLDEHLSENIIVIAGDRREVHEYCIQKKIKTLVITAGFVMDKDLREKAEKNQVSVLISPYDTSSTSMLIVYSTPVSTMADDSVKPVKSADLVRVIRPLLQKSPSRSLPVIDEKRHVIGMISESDLLEEANIETIMIDHNEMSQAVDGIDNYIIKEVIDHHKLGNFSTRYPITFINKPVGATATLIVSLFRENRISIPKNIASILLCAILSDTLALQSATTTFTDRETVEYLSNITNLDVQSLGTEILTAASKIGGRKASEIIHQDMKEYEESGSRFSVSQIEVDNTNELISRKSEFLEELSIEKRGNKYLFSALMVTDITKLTSLLVINSDNSFEQSIEFPKQEEGVYVLKNIVSRKKQLIPLLAEQIEKYSGEI